MRRILNIFPAVLALSIAPVQTVQACSCSAPATATEALERSSAVFEGRVTKLSRPFLDRIGLTSSGRYLVEFKVIRRWKGAALSRSVVKTPLTGEACGYPFEPGKQYLVYVMPNHQQAPTGICTGTKTIADGKSYIKELDKRRAEIH
jgi:hypothetical protein